MNALEQLASIDLIELCKEARIEHCRATRDLSRCGRYVQHVLNSCGHASLCAECSQRCDVCPICRSPIPDNGNRVRLRLYYKCLEAGLISKQHDERFQEKEDHDNPVNMDVQRLHSLFDVALQNNLASLICHYITDVCLDENAVSSDPLLAFLLDEVVIKDWCKRAVNMLISEIGTIYRSGLEMMRSKLSQLQKFAVQLTGISSVVEVMIASFREAVSAHVNDLHQLIENTLKAKQHLEAMIWCTRHKFLEDVCSRHTNFASWSSDVIKRKAHAKERQWPEFSDKASGYNEGNQGILFIEQALQNLGIQQSYRDNVEEVDITCLQNEQSSSMFCSTIDQFGVNSYPFKNLREAVDVLFLHGASDMVIAKQAIFLYYLFDRHWTTPDSEWRYLVDDFAATFGISSRTLLECLVFCLLDDHSSLALEEACSLLPKISSKETHPKIAQVLLERHKPDVALVVLKCAGRDSFFATANVEKDGMSSLSVAVTAVRVRIEYGHLTEAFMYHRSYCSRVKEQRLADMAHVEDAHKSSWMYHVEVMMTEFCNICIERNIVDKMIDLPWDSEEEKHLQKSLFDCAREMPMEPCGSLLVVFHLQRYRYLEAYEVDRSLQSFEQNTLETASEEVASKIRIIAQWRESLVAKCLEMLPEVQREEVRAISSGDQSQFASQTMQMSSPVNHLAKSPNPATRLSSSFTPVLQKKSSPLHSRNVNALTDSGGPVSSARSEFGRKVPSILQGRPVPQGTPTSNTRSTAGSIFPFVGQNSESPYLKGTKEFGFMKGEPGFKKGTTPKILKNHRAESQKTLKKHRAGRLSPHPPPPPLPAPHEMAFRLSNNLIGVLNAITFLLSIPILGAGIWLGTRADGTECERYFSAPVIALGVILMVISVAGLVGACCRVTWLLWVYLLAMFVLIVVLLCLTVFAFVVTNKGAGEAVSQRGFKEYRLGDYSNWLQKRVENTKNWNKIRSCLQDSKVCKSLQDKKETWDQFIRTDLSPIESGCCKPPTSCGFDYVNSTLWTVTNTNSTDPDCRTWSNDPNGLCYGCQSCKAGVVATFKRHWKRVAVVNIVFLVFIIIVYSIGCCAIRNNRRDNAYRAGWKGGYA